MTGLGSEPAASTRRPDRAALLLSALPLLVLAACGIARPEPEALAALEVECEEPRPEVCTREYRPVCALVDTGIRCVTTPCPASEWKLYGNACTACSDADVVGYRRGECSTE